MNEEAPAPRPRQLWLFPPPKPFNDRFGSAFFRSLPREPGVYFFFDGDGRIVYIGKSKSLKQRLNSYRYIHPDRDVVAVFTGYFKDDDYSETALWPVLAEVLEGVFGAPASGR